MEIRNPKIKSHVVFLNGAVRSADIDFITRKYLAFRMMNLEL